MTDRDYLNKLYEAVLAIENTYNNWSKEHGLVYYDMQLYYNLMESPERRLTQKELVKNLQAPKTSINSIVKRQLAKGYIAMNVNPDNQREKFISLTPAGETYAKQLILPLFEQEEQAIAKISHKKIADAIATLSSFAKLLQKD